MCVCVCVPAGSYGCLPTFYVQMELAWLPSLPSLSKTSQHTAHKAVLDAHSHCPLMGGFRVLPCPSGGGVCFAGACRRLWCWAVAAATLLLFPSSETPSGPAEVACPLPLPVHPPFLGFGGVRTKFRGHPDEHTVDGVGPKQGGMGPIPR